MLNGFEDAWVRVADHSQLRSDQMHEIFLQAKRTQRLGGAIADVGCYRGAVGRMALMADQGARPVHFFDTFSGIPKKTPSKAFDSRESGEHHACSTGFIEQQTTFDAKDKGYTKPEIFIHTGVFPDSVKDGSLDDVRYSLVVIDLEIWLSTYEALLYFYPKMIPGGIIALQNYGAPSVMGVLDAYNCFIQDMHIVNTARITSNLMFQAEIVVTEPSAGWATDRAAETAAVEFEDESAVDGFDDTDENVPDPDEDADILTEITVDGPLEERVLIRDIKGKPGEGPEMNPDANAREALVITEDAQGLPPNLYGQLKPDMQSVAVGAQATPDGKAVRNPRTSKAPAKTPGTRGRPKKTEPASTATVKPARGAVRGSR